MTREYETCAALSKLTTPIDENVRGLAAIAEEIASLQKENAHLWTE